MSDRMTVSVQEEDQRGHLVDGAGVSRGTAHTQTVLHLHTQENGYSRRVAPPPPCICWEGVHVTHLAGQHGLNHLRVLTGEHGASQTEDHAHCRQQHEQWHLEKRNGGGVIQNFTTFTQRPGGFPLFFYRVRNGTKCYQNLYGSSLCWNVQYLPPVLKVFSRRLCQLSLRPPPEHTTTDDIIITPP